MAKSKIVNLDDDIVGIIKGVQVVFPDVCYCRDAVTQQVMVFPSRKTMSGTIGGGSTVRAAFRQVMEYAEWREGKIV